MTPLDLPARESTAANILSLSRAEAHTNQRNLPDADATYFWNTTRGGSALIVGADSGVLFAHSSVPFDAHVAAYNEGRRTDPTTFPLQQR